MFEPLTYLIAVFVCFFNQLHISIILMINSLDIFFSLHVLINVTKQNTKFYFVLQISWLFLIILVQMPNVLYKMKTYRTFIL